MTVATLDGVADGNTASANDMRRIFFASSGSKSAAISHFVLCLGTLNSRKATSDGCPDLWDEIGIPAPSAYLISNNTAQVSHPIEPLVIPTQYVDLD